MSETTLLTLPPETLFQILTYLTRPDLCASVLVSRAWSTTFTPHLWSNLQLRAVPRQPPRDHHWDVLHDQREPWFMKLKRSILAGGLARNGHLVRTFVCGYYGAVELLAEYGGTCVGLKELAVGSEVDPGVPFSETMPDMDLTPLVTVLERNSQLRRVKLIGRMLDERHPGFGKLLRAIPASVEDLELKKWDLLRGKRKFHFQIANDIANGIQSDKDDDKDGGYVSNTEEIGYDAATSPRFPRLKRLALHSYGVDINKRTLEYVLTHSPNLETLRLQDSGQPIPLKFLTQLLSLHCPRLINLHVLDWHTLLDAELAGLLDVCKAGWRILGLPQNYYYEHHFGPLSTAALLRHAPTLENVRLDGSWRLPSITMQQLLSSAPNLKRLDAISKDRSYSCNFNMDAQDIVNGADWVCTGLGSLKIQIGGIPRPDIKTHMNGRPFDAPQDLLHQSTTTMTASRAIQHKVYTQLSRLTNLRQLILGHDDVERENGCEEREAHSEGEYYERKATIENGYQYECLEMTLDSGLGLLGSLKGLRKLEIDAMALGEWSAEGRERDERWKEENWRELERHIWMEWERRVEKKYSDHFWFHLGYLSYY
ncbi:hypothetical protein BG015_011987 [Linnemannia schmuckeri]|uniref:F-box domain-containing protein n=1 Tax=Linnemannia schmuckeri TaxID=64567 RepID=A0A9P5RS08_9FUNG|nr:hypothetical protein BG015_011987 [Linnemannia schmuckeri]